ncbi:FxLYD domain-containing protein [Desulfobacterota bacterium AH_259_B03_O07]|nr:FxLYD domain-containing protein [Desulfobacterota bacterium AH_259_B03_O07]
MKRLLSIISTFCLCLVVFWACADADEDGSVKLSGPILESISPEGNLEFNGSVVNDGGTPVQLVFVLITLKDENGDVVGANSVQVGEDDPDGLLFPGERKFFSITMTSVPSEVVSKDVEVFFDPAENF